MGSDAVMLGTNGAPLSIVRGRANNGRYRLVKSTIVGASRGAAEHTLRAMLSAC